MICLITGSTIKQKLKVIYMFYLSWSKKVTWLLCEKSGQKLSRLRNQFPNQQEGFCFCLQTDNIKDHRGCLFSQWCWMIPLNLKKVFHLLKMWKTGIAYFWGQYFKCWVQCLTLPSSLQTGSLVWRLSINAAGSVHSKLTRGFFFYPLSKVICNSHLTIQFSCQLSIENYRLFWITGEKKLPWFNSVLMSTLRS